MSVELFIVLMVFWHIIGGVALSVFRDTLEAAQGLEFLNPCFIYKHAKVNWFGVLVLTLFYNALFPICTISYWFYKLCTIGRKSHV